MSKIYEIRWHGRGGQGAKTASMLLAEAAVDSGKYIQAFPEYGPERAGAPIKAFNRLSDAEIHIHCGIENPDAVVVLDPTLLKSVNVTEGLGCNGILIVNSELTPEEIRKSLNFKIGKVYSVNANKIAMETIGQPIPNTPMLGALITATQIISIEAIKEKFKDKFEKKLNEKIIQSNFNALERAKEEVKEG